MRRDALERVTMDLLSLPPLIHRSLRRKLVRSTLADMNMDITPHHFEILHFLQEEGIMCIGIIGERLQIAKAQMTQLIDKLVALNLVERQPSTEDRRITNITLTSHGHAVLDEDKNRVIDAIRDTMARLTDEELQDLSQSLRKVQDILSKLL
jgi:DNA-binding MarR family transcriptional regulator